MKNPFRSHVNKALFNIDMLLPSETQDSQATCLKQQWVLTL